jgi:RNA-directed DNA polymerase
MNFKITHEQLIADVFRAYYDARRHKRNTASQLKFELDLEENLVQLTHDIENRTYEVGRSICFIVDRPVKREVFAADFRDRVMHHLLFNYLAPLFERTFIYDCYSCRKGFGTHMGVNRIAGFARKCSQNFKRDAYVLKLDISGYFMSINRKRLLTKLYDTMDKFSNRRSIMPNRKWKELLDYDLLKYLLEKIVLNDPKEGCLLKGDRSNWKGLPKSKSLFYAAPHCGLPIGNLTSQLFSNVYLSSFDGFMKRDEHLHFYGRYVDDFVVASADKQHLKELVVKLESKLREEGMTLHPKKRYLQHISKGFDFLGLHQRKSIITPGRRMLHNMRVMRREYLQKTMRTSLSYEQAKMYITRLNSYLGMMRHCASKQIRDAVWSELYNRPHACILLDGAHHKAVINPSEVCLTT